jgi:hypothetical protein
VDLEVLGLAVASGACLDFATGMDTSWSKANTHKGKNASAT